MARDRETLAHMLSRAIRYSVSDGVPYRSGCVALVVGTILNLINQGDAILEATSINWIKVVLILCLMPSAHMVRFPIGCRDPCHERLRFTRF